ncbi:MAG TPA: hypothetical protein DDW85_02450 [Porphyromonadaceae bacterium]|nr:hypothetical protein [Porphyromonadaceae bacterium]
MDKLYFKDEDDCFCSPLVDRMNDAKEDGLSEIELMEADPDFDNPNYIFCGYMGEAGDRSECRKSLCSYYESKSGRGVCKHRGKLFTHGERVKFKVE